MVTFTYSVLLYAVLLFKTDAAVLSLTGLPQGAVCPDEVTVLTCSIDSAAIEWRIPAYSVNVLFNNVGEPIGSDSRFVTTLITRSSDLTNSTLSFTGNSTLNGVVVICAEIGNPIEKNITLNYTDATPPSSPIAVSTTVLNCSSMSISWAPPTNTGGEGIDITSYTITLSPSPNTPHNTDCTEGGVCNTTSTSIILAGLQYGTDYTISINASNCAGTGNGYTTVKKIIFESDNTVWSPLNVSVISCDMARLSWQPIPVQQQGMLSYNITGYFQQSTTADTQFNISLTCDTNYTLSVQAIVCNETVIGYTDTQAAVVTSPGTSPPSSPSNLTVTALNCSHVQLQWIPPTPASDYPIIYWVSYWSSSGSINQTTNTVETSLTVQTPDIVNSSHTFTVSASVCNCSQHQSENISISIPAIGSVQNLTIMNCNSNDTRLVRWDVPLLNDSSPVENYSVSIVPPPSSSDCQCPNGSCTVSMTTLNISKCFLFNVSYTVSVASIIVSECESAVIVTPEYVTCLPMKSTKSGNALFPTYIWIIIGVCGGLILGALIILIVSCCYYCIRKKKVENSRSKSTATDKEERVYIEIKEQPPEIPRAQVSPDAPPSPREPLPDRVPILTAEETQPEEPPSPLPPLLPRPFQPDSVVETNEKVQYAELSSVRPAIKPPLMEAEKVTYSSVSHTIPTSSMTPPIPPKGKVPVGVTLIN